MTTMKLASPAMPSRTGVWVGIAAISMSFAAFTSAMVFRAAAAPDWQHFRLPSILYLNTFVLLASSATLERARSRFASAADQPAVVVVRWLVATLALGLLFIAGQVAAWRALVAQGLFLATSPSSSFFYVFTALHALHLLGGVAAMLYVIVRFGRPTGPSPAGALSAASLYWHFMDALWVYLLLVLTIRI
jgi:cytochrome c oxidase subunit III